VNRRELLLGAATVVAAAATPDLGSIATWYPLDVGGDFSVEVWIRRAGDERYVADLTIRGDAPVEVIDSVLAYCAGVGAGAYDVGEAVRDVVPADGDWHHLRVHRDYVFVDDELVLVRKRDDDVLLTHYVGGVSAGPLDGTGDYVASS
jgi:hypothetical protein